MKKMLTFMFALLILGISACAPNDLGDGGLGAEASGGISTIAPTEAPTETPTQNGNSEEPAEIAFVFQDEMPLLMEPLPILDKNEIESVIYSEQILSVDGVDITQGFYKNANRELPHFVNSYLEIDGNMYDLGHITHTGDDDILSGGSEFFRFMPEESFKLDASDITIYQQHKSYGSKYATVAYYYIEDGVPFFLTEILIVLLYCDVDSSGVAAILSSDYSLPFTECTVSKIDLLNGVLQFTNLTELLECDSVYYEKGLFYTFHRPTEPNWEVLTKGKVYSFDNGVFSGGR